MLKSASLKSPLHQMTQTTPTCLWNDSAAETELAYAIEHGAVGATCNPVIAVDVIKQESAYWTGRIKALAAEHPTADEGQLAWSLIEAMSAERSVMLRSIFDAQAGRNGRLSIQTDPRLYRNGPAIVAQAVQFAALAPNMIVKIPATQAGIWAIEEVTALGISINATVSFTVAQAIAVAEAVERGLSRREAQGADISTMGPVCTIMVGRLDDWLKTIAEKQSVTIDAGHLEWAGVAAFKQAYRLYMARGYRLRLLSAAFRNHRHWSELIGGDVVISPPHAWQKRFNAGDVEVKSRIDNPVDPAIVGELLQKFPEFRRAYEPAGLSVAEFDSFGPTVRTLRQFAEACHELERLVRDILLPNPDTALASPAQA